MARQNPWTLAPAADYEAYMGPDGADQLAPLSAILKKALGALRPARLLALGVATGNGLEHVDPAVTRRVVGVDVNIQYVAIARQRHMWLGPRLELFVSDVERVHLEPASFDLAWAALLFEHVDARAVARRIAGWLAPGGALVAVLQLPGPEAAPPRQASMRAVVDATRLVPPADLEQHLAAAGMRLRRAFEVPVAHGRRLWVGHFTRPK